MYIFPIALHVSIVHSIQGKLMLDTIRCSIVKSDLLLFIDGIVQALDRHYVSPSSSVSLSTKSRL